MSVRISLEVDNMRKTSTNMVIIVAATVICLCVAAYAIFFTKKEGD